MEYISLRGYIRNTPSDTEMHAERGPCPDQWKRIYRSTQNLASNSSWTIERVAHQMLPTELHRVGPHPGCPFKCLTRQSTGEDPRQGALLCAWCTKQQKGPQAREPSKCLKGQRYRERLAKEAFWSPATSLEKRLWQGHNSCRGSPCPCTLGTARVPASRATMPPSCSTLTGAELPQAKKVLHLCIQGRFGHVWLFATLWTVSCQASLSERGFSRQAYWSVLTNTGCHTLREHYISCCPSLQPPEYLVLPEPLRPKQLHHLHTWPSQGQTQVLQGRLRSKPQWTTPVQRWK